MNGRKEECLRSEVGILDVYLRSEGSFQIVALKNSNHEDF
jgi:hypothetical protein